MKTLVIRKSDNAIFERCSAPCRENAPIFLRLEWVRRSFWWGGKFVRTGETWQTDDESLYEVLEREYVIAGVKALARHSRRA